MAHQSRVASGVKPIVSAAARHPAMPLPSEQSVLQCPVPTLRLRPGKGQAYPSSERCHAAFLSALRDAGCHCKWLCLDCGRGELTNMFMRGSPSLLSTGCLETLVPDLSIRSSRSTLQPSHPAQGLGGQPLPMAPWAPGLLRFGRW